MFIKLGSRAAPVILLVLSSLWMGAAIFLLLHSLMFPNADIMHFVEALKGRETPRADVGRLVHQAGSVVGLLRHAIPVGAYWGGSAEFKIGETHTTKTIEIYYLAWFDKRSHPTILTVTRTEEDRSSVSLYIHEGTFFGAVRLYLIPASLLALSIYWFKRKRSFDATINASEPLPPGPTEAPKSHYRAMHK